MSDQRPIRVVVVDDHPLMRDGLKALLASVPDLVVVGEAGNGEQARREVQLERPDLVLMDLNMPGTNGIAATRAILQDVPGTRVLVLTMLDDDDSVFAAMRAGALGYVLKGAQQDEILHAVRSVAAGQAVFGPGVAHRIVDLLTAGPQRTSTTPPFPQLTPREREVLDLIAAGRNNREIARHLVISPKTVSNHISAVFAALQVADRAAAIIQARQAGLGG